MLEDFWFSKYSISTKAKETIVLPPYKGSALRGGFGWAFKRTVCTMKSRRCDDCLLRSKCIYSYVFETQPSEDSNILRNYNRVPHPFVIEPPLEEKRIYETGEELSFNLVLIGKACEYLPYFIYTFEELGSMGIGKRKGKYIVHAVKSLQPIIDKPVYTSQERKLEGRSRTVTLADYYSMPGKGSDKPKEADSLKLSFLTPLRLITDGDLVVELKFHHLIRSLLRRASTLMYFHCGKRLDADFKGIINKAEAISTAENALKWYDWERYSQRQNTRMMLGGLMDSVVFTGELYGFMEIIRFGEVVHAGKGTAFGLGMYKAAIS